MTLFQQSGVKCSIEWNGHLRIATFLAPTLEDSRTTAFAVTHHNPTEET